FAVSVCVVAAVKVHGLVMPVQVPPDQLARWLPLAGGAVMGFASPAPTVQWAALVQWALVLASLTVAVPLPVAAAVIVTVCTKFAVSVCVVAAVKVQDVAIPLQVPPDQLASWLPLVGVAVMVMASPAPTVQWAALVQWALVLASLTVAVPLPVAAAVIVTLCTKFAVSVSVAAAVKVQDVAIPLQVPPDQLASWLPLVGVAV